MPFLGSAVPFGSSSLPSSKHSRTLPGNSLSEPTSAASRETSPARSPPPPPLPPLPPSLERDEESPPGVPHWIQLRSPLAPTRNGSITPLTCSTDTAKSQHATLRSDSSASAGFSGGVGASRHTDASEPTASAAAPACFASSQPPPSPLQLACSQPESAATSAEAVAASGGSSAPLNAVASQIQRSFSLDSSTACRNISDASIGESPLPLDASSRSEP